MELQLQKIFQGAAYTTAPKSKHVFSNTTIVMASSAALITNSCGSSVAVPLGGSTTCDITVNDVNVNTMPAGTTVAFSVNSVRSGITLTAETYSFPNTSAAAGAILAITLSDGGTAPTLVGRAVLTVKVTSPGGVVTSKNYPVN